MKKWIAILLAFVLLTGILAGCKEEIDLTPDDEMTIAIAALARSAKAQREAVKPTQYTVKGVRTLDGVKTAESTASYDTETLLTVTEERYFDGENETGSQLHYTFVASHLGETDERFEIVSATQTTENGITTKEYKVLHTAENPQDIQRAWTEGGYGADMTYQTYGRLEDLIVSCAMSQGGAKAKVTSAKDFTLELALDNRTEHYTVENNLITRFVWTEMTTNGEDESVWSYQWDVAEITLPDLSDSWILVTE